LDRVASRFSPTNRICPCGRRLAEGDWVIAGDIDHFFPAEGLIHVLSMAKDPGTVYYFGRKKEDGSPKHPYPNSFLIPRKTFWAAGGYDEDYGSV